jgi:tryptophanyl-tRNA synthetase
MKKIILTGDRPSGALHLGHYVGSLKNRVQMQNEFQTYIIIANLQAMTDYFDRPEQIRENINSLVKDYIACGIDPNVSTIFVQSKVKALPIMTMYFMNLVSLARVRRNPTVKEELERKEFKNNVNCGFVCYPISQAADILAFDADIVPVGKDQKPMIEQTNEIVDSFNFLYKDDVFKKCKAVFGQTAKLMGIDGKAKASKSLGNAISLSDTEEILKQKVFSMYTDPMHLKVQDPGRVEGNMVFHYLDAFYDEVKTRELREHYEKGGLGDMVLKKLLFDVLQEFLEPIRQKRKNVTQDDIDGILFQGNKRANEKADSVLERMERSMKFD